MSDKQPRKDPRTSSEPDGDAESTRDRRRSRKIEARHEVEFDAKGNPVWQVRVDSPSRRQDDDTFDLLKCLDVEGLSLSDEEPATDKGLGYDPYARDVKKKK